MMLLTVALAVPVRDTSLKSSKSVTASLKTTVKLIGLVLVGSAWPAAWLIVTLGARASYNTLLSVLVEATLRLTPSVATPAGMLATTVPSLFMLLTATLYVVGPPVMRTVVAPAVPLRVTSAASSKSVIGSLKTTVKLIGLVPVGSLCPLAWLIVAVG